MLRLDGTRIVGADGKEVLLRGAGLGGWMNMENFITGFPGREYQIRAALDEVLGVEKSQFFFDKFLENFFSPADATFFAELGLNCIRIPFNYRHFEDDMNPRVLKPEGLKWLDRVVNICASKGIYTILDLHTVPGSQNGDWHSDSGSHIAEFWAHKDFQDRAIWLWQELAKHYKGNTWIAGYNPLNEPCDPTANAGRLKTWYVRVYDAIREIDPDHLIYLDGNTFASDFSCFDIDTCKRWTGVVYSIHDYSNFGFPLSSELYQGTEEQKAKLLRGYNRKVTWMKEHGLPIWNGEFGPVYARKQYEENNDEINVCRVRLLKDQLQIYDEERIPWSIWTYKDIGYQGMCFVSPDTPYMKLFKSFLEKKYMTAVDAWGADESHVAHIWGPLEKWFAETVDPKYRNLYPHPVWKFENRISRLSRNILLAEYMVKEWADHFKGMDEKQLEEIAGSFAFENCIQRDGVNKALKEHRG